MSWGNFCFRSRYISTSVWIDILFDGVSKSSEKPSQLVTIFLLSIISSINSMFWRKYVFESMTVGHFAFWMFLFVFVLFFFGCEYVCKTGGFFGDESVDALFHSCCHGFCFLCHILGPSVSGLQDLFCSLSSSKAFLVQCQSALRFSEEWIGGKVSMLGNSCVYAFRNWL